MDQCLHFTSHHRILVYHKPTLHGPVSPLHLTSSHTSTTGTKGEDREAGDQLIKDAPVNCGYPVWSITTVKDQIRTSKVDKKREKERDKGKRV